MKSKLLAAAALAIAASTPCFAACPPGSVPVTTGPYQAESCVGSPQPGLVAQTLPYQPSTSMGFSSAYTPTRSDPIFPMRERAPVQDSPSLPSWIGNIASVETEQSARPSPWPGIPAKLAADWAFLHDGSRLIPGSRMLWAGGILSRSADGKLRFDSMHPGADFHAEIDRYRSDLPGFLAAAGPVHRGLLGQIYAAASR